MNILDDVRYARNGDAPIQKLLQLCSRPLPEVRPLPDSLPEVQGAALFQPQAEIQALRVVEHPGASPRQLENNCYVSNCVNV